MRTKRRLLKLIDNETKNRWRLQDKLEDLKLEIEREKIRHDRLHTIVFSSHSGQSTCMVKVSIEEIIRAIVDYLGLEVPSQPKQITLRKVKTRG